ncbi:MAG TPA: fatty acid desaturase [Alphaproteobacteria bacterium]|jgi:omega-6 fatty acid desaturase (delta-12 desaturase)|nr:fatty acid desaturase [Alphaproteobacteria bacterium]
MSESTVTAQPAADAQPGLRALVRAYETPSILRSSYQIASSIGFFLAACAGMYWSLNVSYLLTLALAFPTAGLLVRVFIIQHDCGHGAFFRSRKLNDLLGQFCALLTFTPYAHWRRQHNCHHRNWNNLDRREPGLDIYSTCVTVAEYHALSRWNRFKYRVMLHPIMAYVIIPPVVFLLMYRVPFDTPKDWTRERRSVYLTNLAVIALLATLMLRFGVWQVLLVQVPVVALTSMIGVGLFSLQHRFEGTVWARQGEWNSVKASLHGSSYFKLPRALQWFTGNIGFHHIHHLNPKVANYRLEACHNAIPALREGVTTLNWLEGVRALRLALWSETDQRMVGFADAGKRPA